VYGKLYRWDGKMREAMNRQAVFLLFAGEAWRAGDTQSAKEAMYILSGFLVGYGMGMAYANRERSNTP
jgi:hypothetical protein